MASDHLRYVRKAIAAGEFWRLLTAHLVHLNFGHAALDIAGLLLLWALFARDLSPGRWALVILAAAAAVDGGLWFGDPFIEWYVGSSGVLHGVLAAAVFIRLRRRDIEGWPLAGLLVAKLAYEQIRGAMPFDGGMPVVVDAHLYGALGGLAAAVLLDLIGLEPHRRSLPEPPEGPLAGRSQAGSGSERPPGLPEVTFQPPPRAPTARN